MMTIKLLNPINYQGWDDIIESNSTTSIFHSSHWSKVLIDTYKYKPHYFTTIENKSMQNLIPIMEVSSILTGRRGISLPFSDYCEPILSDKQQLNAAVDRVIRYGRKAGWKYIELRLKNNQAKDWPCFNKYFGHTLDLSNDTEAVFSGLKSNVRRNIRKAQRMKVQIQHLHSISSLREYYRLHCLTRQRKGLPPQSYNFFYNIYKHIISPGLGFVLLAKYNKRYIAGGIFFCYGKNAQFKFGASEYSYRHTKANDLLIWQAIEWFCKNGFKQFCFGRTHPTNLGLRKYKEGWGTQEKIIRYYRYNYKKGDFIENPKTTKSKVSLFKLMPVPLLRVIGRISYKHIG